MDRLTGRRSTNALPVKSTLHLSKAPSRRNDRDRSFPEKIIPAVAALGVDNSGAPCNNTIGRIDMPSKVREPSRPRPAPAKRVDAPPTQNKAARRLPPAYTLAWLHLLPKSEFPIRSRDELAAKISALLLGRASPREGVGHGLPAGAQPQSQGKT
jgi:hypothetical protein